MFKNTKNDYIGWLAMFGALVLGLEVLFFNRGLIFSLIFSCGLMYLGRKKAGKKRGRVLFIAGVFFFIISIINMMTFKFLLLAFLLHFFIQFITSKKNPKKIQLEVAEHKQDPFEETMYKSKPLFENIFLGQQKTPQGVYEWEDINIQTGIGDTMIDLSYTMLPKGETVIFIRNIIGNMQILVPYEIEVSIHHSCMAGSTNIFDHHEPKVFNQVIHLKTPGYETAEQKVKIFTSLVVGNLEVSRI